MEVLKEHFTWTLKQLRGVEESSEELEHLATYLAVSFDESDLKEWGTEDLVDWEDKVEELLEEFDAQVAEELREHGEELLQNLKETLFALYLFENKESAPGNAFQPGEHVLAVLQVDGLWHPASIVQVIEESQENEDKPQQYLVRFKQFGNPQVTNAEDIVLDLSMQEDAGNVYGDRECRICRREMKLTFHHLIPKETHSHVLKKGKLIDPLEDLYQTSVEKGWTRKVWLGAHGIMVCRPCHTQIHRVASNDVLALEFNTLDKLLGTPSIRKWKSWAQKQRIKGVN